MREIKFRAWDKKQIEIYGTGMSYCEPEYFDDMLAFRFNHFESDNPSEIIYEQFTGLRDKNGKEIYEGDIIESHGLRGKIWYREDTVRYCCSPDVYDFDDAIVIGNIHENQELLNA